MSHDIRTGWKILTHDWRSPLQGGDPICDGELPLELPRVELDTGPAECAAGWNYCGSLTAALAVAGIWPSGRPARGLLVSAGADAIERGGKRRASSLRLERLASEQEWEAAIREFSRALAPHSERMVSEQMAWRHALGRPKHDAQAVTAGLRLALERRRLDWSLEQFDDAGDARAAWAAWAARDARAAWAARDGRDAWDARDAWGALTVTFAALQDWIRQPPDLLSAGVRDAYAAGLAAALPVGPQRLGWAMEAAA